MIFFTFKDGFNMGSLSNIIGIIFGVVVFLIGVGLAATETDSDDTAGMFCIGGLFVGILTWIFYPIFISIGLVSLLVYGIYKLMKIIVTYEPKTKEETETNIYSDADKYKKMLSEAIETISKYHTNLSKTKLTPEGKSIVVAVGASIDKISQIIKNSNSERITIDVFEKAYQAIKANRIELQRAEKLVSLGIEDQLEQEIKLMKATLPR